MGGPSALQSRRLLHLPTRLVLLGAAAALAVTSLWFARRQNQRRQLGGGISLPKLGWLFFCLFTWFVLCPALALDPAVAAPWRLTLGAFAISMWLRGGIELYLLYGPKTWKPPMGIAHDLFCLGLIGAFVLANRAPIAAAGRRFDRWVGAVVAVVALSLVIEVLYAALFFRAARGNTTGANGIWFADEKDPSFRAINRLTCALNLPLFAFLAVFLAVAGGLIAP